MMEMKKDMHKSKDQNKKSTNILMGVLIFTFLIFKNLYEIYTDYKDIINTRIKSLLVYFLLLPLFFLINLKIYPNMFIPYTIVCLSLIILVEILQSPKDNYFIKKGLIFLVINFGLLIYDYCVSFDNFFFFYYQNIILQSIILIMFVLWTLFLFFKGIQ